VRFTRKTKIAAAAGALAVAVAVPTTVAFAQSNGDVTTGQICFDVEDSGLPFAGEFPFEAPFGEEYDGEIPFGIFEQFAGELPFDEEFLGEIRVFIEEFPVDELIQDLFESLDGDGPLGFFEEFEGFDGEIPFDGGFLEKLEGLFGDGEFLGDFEIPFDGEFLEEMEGFFGDGEFLEEMEGFFGDGEFLEEMEGFGPDGFIGGFGGPFLGGFPFHNGFPLHGLSIEDGEICVPGPGARAETLQAGAAELLEAMRSAGLDVETETIEIEVPVVDGDDPAVREFFKDYLFGRSDGEDAGVGQDRAELPWDLEGQMEDGEFPELPFGYDDLIREGQDAEG
jgi:hypothetical protein